MTNDGQFPARGGWTDRVYMSVDGRVDGPALASVRHHSALGIKNLHIIMLTGMTESEQIVAGLNAGANDFITKPFKEAELQARVNVGARMVQLQLDLAKRVRELEKK